MQIKGKRTLYLPFDADKLFMSPARNHEKFSNFAQFSETNSVIFFLKTILSSDTNFGRLASWRSSIGDALRIGSIKNQPLELVIELILSNLVFQLSLSIESLDINPFDADLYPFESKVWMIFFVNLYPFDASTRFGTESLLRGLKNHR